MKEFYFNIAAFILLVTLIGGIRIVLGPSKADRMLAIQYFSTSGIAISLLMAETLSLPGLRDLALVLVALATITTVAFSRVYSRSSTEPKA